MKNKFTYYCCKYFLLVSICLFSITSIGQTFADKNHYLVDSLNLEILSLREQKLINSSLNLYHNAKHDTLKIKVINHLVEESWDDSVWPKYNKWLYTYIQEKLVFYKAKNKNGLIIEKLTKSLGESLNNMGVFHSNEGNYIKALENYKQSLKIMVDAGYKKEIAVCLNNIGYIHIIEGRAVNALEFYLKSLSIKKEINDEKGIANSLNNIAQIYYNYGDVTKALEYYIRSLQIEEKLKNERGMSASLNNIAVVYLALDEKDKALEYHLKSLELNKTIGDKKLIAVILSNIGLIYISDENYQKGLEYFNKALVMSEKVSNKQGLIYSLKNIGVVYNNIGEHEKALSYFKRGLKISEKIKDKKEIAGLLHQIASVYVRQNKLFRAKKRAKESMTLAQELGYPLRIRDASEILKVIYKKENNWKEAFKMNELFVFMRDSLRNEKIEKDAIRQQAKYDLEKKELELSKSEDEVKLLSSKNEIQKLTLNRNRYLIAFFSMAFSLVTIVILFVFRENKKKKGINKLLKIQKEDITKKNEEKKVLLKEIHHRVKNNLQMVNSLLNIESREIKDKNVVAIFVKAQKRVVSMAMLHEKMYNSEDLKHIDVKEYVSLLISDLVNSYTIGKKIDLDIVVENIDIGMSTLVPLGLIINEIITNSFKHAFIDTSEGAITVHIKQLENKSFEMYIGDNGIGMTDGVKPSKTGTKLINAFVRQLNGTIELLKKDGTMYRIVFEKIDTF